MLKLPLATQARLASDALWRTLNRARLAANAISATSIRDPVRNAGLSSTSRYAIDCAMGPVIRNRLSWST
jgi:hypothetical protein